MNSISPLSESRSRRIRSRESPCGPHGTKDSTALNSPSPSVHSSITQRPSSGSPSRPRAMLNPRSVAPSRQSSARFSRYAISSAGMSSWRRIRTVYPARFTRL